MPRHPLGPVTICCRTSTDVTVRTMRAFVIALVCLLGPANWVHAAEPPKVEVSGGYVFLDNASGNSTPHFNGWTVAVAGYLHESVALVGDVTGVYATFTRDSRPKFYNFMVGPKFIFPQQSMPMLIPFVQVLVGVSRFDFGLRGYGYDPETNFAVQPGGGVDVGFASKISLRFQTDYGLIGGKEAFANTFRFVIGMVVHD